MATRKGQMVEGDKVKRAVRNGDCDDASRGRASKLALGKCCFPFATLRPVAFLPAEFHTEQRMVG